MLYEMIAVVRTGNAAEVKEIALKAGSLILAHGGIVRGITNWGSYLLTKPVKKLQRRHDRGHHFIMRFDAGPQTQRMVRKTIAIDPRMIRCGVVKLGGSLAEIAPWEGEAKWRRTGNHGMAAGLGIWNQVGAGDLRG